jgi:uncharacterized protein
MFHSLKTALDAGHSLAMILGSDAPTLPAAHLDRLLASRADVTLGPCEDGGYYAIACRRVHREMFDGVEWSGPMALEQTRLAAMRCGLEVELGPVWFDVDGPADLQRLASTGSAPHLRSVEQARRMLTTRMKI